MKKFWQKLKLRWGIESDLQVAIILLVFTLTGFSFLYIQPWIDRLLGMGPDAPFWKKALVFVIVLLPLYNILLIVWGSTFGQYRFFKNFVIKFLSRLLPRKKK